jgi:hypothetical protein
MLTSSLIAEIPYDLIRVVETSALCNERARDIDQNELTQAAAKECMVNSVKAGSSNRPRLVNTKEGCETGVRASSSGYFESLTY